ncbi:6322_t:CDS:2 [Acaulospora colombiana]|uniref:6322_t:CDS:1 n=1 Tax=Acaulospora colombiana TaxID=27376 RepID=A0ACA9LWV4_9GLOM|nr:6322_t:CDS:2 [Acaulospora colombiana]
MGWEPGKGLGLNEDGARENIQLSVKQDYLGIGASKRTIDNWLDNSFAFDALLKELNSGRGDDPNDKKLSEKAISSGNDTNSTEFRDSKITPPTRLAHRAKFLKSKKDSVRDTVRLNEIFGIKTKPDSLSATDITNETAVQNDLDDNFGVQTVVNKLSIEEYFSSKTKLTVKSEATPSEERSTLEANNFEFRQNEEIMEFTGLGYISDSTKKNNKSIRAGVDDINQNFRAIILSVRFSELR